MAFELQVEFEFLCAFVPDHADPAHQKMLVLLPDLHEGFSIAGAHLGHHFGVFRYHVAQGQPDHGLKLDDDSLEPGLGLRGVILNGVDMKFLPGGEEALNSAPTFDLNRHLMSMESAAKLLGDDDFGHADPERLTLDKPSAKKMDLAARVALQGGRLEVRKLTHIAFDLHLKGMQPSDGVDLQQVSRQVRWTLPVAHDFVDVVLQPFGQGTPSKIRIRPEGDDPEVVVGIRNCESEFKYATGLPGYSDERQELMAFLPLSKAYDPDNPPPQLLMTSRTHSTHGVCSPARFA